MQKEHQWFVAQLKPNGLGLARQNLDRQNIASFAPLMPATGQKSGQKSGQGAGQRRGTKPRPLFPGYLFVAFDPGRPGWAAINNTRGVLRLVLSDPRRPVPLPAGLIAGLQARCDASGLLQDPDRTEALQTGDRIRVIAGPFADLVTRIDSLPDADRVGVLIEILNRPVKTTLAREVIEKLP